MRWAAIVAALIGALFVGGIFLVVAPTMAKAQSPSRSFKDCSECPEMVPIPPGSFVMGVPSGEEERENLPQHLRGWSAPQHTVAIRQGFAMSKYTVTRAEFAAFVMETGYVGGDKCWLAITNTNTHLPEWKLATGFSWRHTGYAQTDRDPVICVSWDDAKAYIAWLSKKAARPYRLPTEAEWEYAARAGSAAARFWGDDRSQACRYANVADLAKLAPHNPKLEPFKCSSGFVATAPVGSFLPNAFGLHDMLGNVWQLVEDCWNNDYQGAPDDGSAWLAGYCKLRVLRGGSYNDDPALVRTGNRNKAQTGLRGHNWGFRVAAPPNDVISDLPQERKISPLLARD